MKRLLIVMVAVIIAVYAGLVVAGGINRQDTTQEAVYQPTKYEIGPPDQAEMLELVNKARKEEGVKPLVQDKNVTRTAEIKANDFAKRDYYSHTVKGTSTMLTLEMKQLVGHLCTEISENIAADMYTSRDAFDGWMQSPKHRAAILSDKYAYTGFGVSQDKDGDYY